jgi:elongation factor P
MKISGNSIRPGMVIEHQGKLWQAVRIQHTQPGKGGAYLQVELKNLRDGSKLNERFRSSENVERVRLEQLEHQFIYAEGDMLTFMNTETYDQVSVSKDLVGEAAVYLAEGMVVTIESYDGSPLNVVPPDTAILEVRETEPAVKGQTATASYKPAVLENGVRMMVPPFVAIGDKIVVSIADGTYTKRAEA